MTMLEESTPPRRVLHHGIPHKKMGETIERLYNRNAMVSLQKVFSKVIPADLAHILENFPNEMVERLFEQIPDPRGAAMVLREISPPLQKYLVSALDLKKMIPVLEQMAPDTRADIINHLEPELASLYLAGLNQQAQRDVQSLMQYPSDTAGGLMTSQYFALAEKTTVAQAIERVRQLTSYEMVFYVYVVNDMGRLTGVTSLRQLLLSPAEKTMSEIMNRRTVKVRTDTSQEEVAQMASHYRLLAVPVVDDEDILVGLVTVDDVIHVIREEVSDEMLKVAGTSTSEGEVNSAWEIFKIRLPWLLTTFIGGMIASAVVVQFEETLAKAVLLAAFLPVILGMAGNFGTIASTVVVHNLAAGSFRSYFSLLTREVTSGGLMGLCYGTLAAGISWLVFRDLLLTSAVSLTILTNMTMAGAVAVSLPLLFQRLGAEPSKASGPMVTMMVDLAGVCLYFLISWMFHGILTG